MQIQHHGQRRGLNRVALGRRGQSRDRWREQTEAMGGGGGGERGRREEKRNEDGDSAAAFRREGVETSSDSLYTLFANVAGERARPRALHPSQAFINKKITVITTN